MNDPNTESLSQIGNSIQKHRKAEIASYASISAIGRCLGVIKSSLYPQMNGRKIFWLTNREATTWGAAYSKDGQPVYKNTKLGEILSKYYSGNHQYVIQAKEKRQNTVDVELFNRATYSLTQNSVKEILIRMADDSIFYRFQRLEDLVRQCDELEQRLLDLKKQQEEELKAIELARQEAENARLKQEEAEAERLRLERKRKEEEEARHRIEIEKLEAQLQAAKEQTRLTQSYIRDGESLRSQHILDQFQEEAKRSHLYDGVPIVIEGGPGTGKTTTMIQRLKFLISSTALLEYDAPLSAEQISKLTDPQVRNEKWLFFSPTERLLTFLRQNMAEEELIANEFNSTTLDTFCLKMFKAYKLRIPEKEGPFKWYNHRDDERILVWDAPKAIARFEKFLVHRICTILTDISELSSSSFPWHRLAVEIKSYCAKAKDVTDIKSLVRLLDSMQNNEVKEVRKQEEQLQVAKDKAAFGLLDLLVKDESVTQSLMELFEEWDDDENEQEEVVSDSELDETEEEEEASGSLDFRPRLYKELKPLLQKLGLMTIDSKAKLSSRQSQLYALVKGYVDRMDLSEIGHLAWFKKNFALPCKGIESNVFNQIPRIYKEFRRNLVKMNADYVDQRILQSLLKKDSGKLIHREEVELIIGFLNHMILGIYKKSTLRFKKLANNKYVRAYIENVKPVLGIDEATDFSYLDYYFITSFKHYEFHSITLCGDSMQCLNTNGIENWNQLRDFCLPNLQVYELKESYRQLPTLLEMSKSLYRDEMHQEAPYSSTLKRSNREPVPLCYISDDLEKKARWISKRVVDIYKYYNEQMPSVAILVGDEVDIPELVDTIRDLDILNGIEVYDCSENRTPNSTKCLRVFRLSEVKGMEFEVVFFYDIDEALGGHSLDMMRRYLYVGISRATSHLAATFTREDGNEDILKYFDRTKKNWKI